MDARKVLYNRPKGYYAVMTYFVESPMGPTLLCNTFGPEGIDPNIYSIEIDGRLVGMKEIQWGGGL